MSMRWFRVHTSLLHNPKFQRLPDSLKVKLLNVWCAAAQHDGVLPPCEHLAFLLRLSPAETRKTLDRLSEVGFIDQTERGLQPHGWDQHQYVSDTSTGRVKKHREKVKRERNVSETRGRNVSVTPSETETEQSTESETLASLAPEQRETTRVPVAVFDADTYRPDDSDVANLWEEFQAAYPEPKRTVAVEKSCRAYVGRIAGAPGEHGKLMDGLRRHLASEQWRRSLRENGGRYIPTMERFIADGLYLDHPPVEHEPEAQKPKRYEPPPIPDGKDEETNAREYRDWLDSLAASKTVPQA